MPATKAIKSDKVTEEFGIEHITLRGVEYTIRELDVTEYDECQDAVKDEDGGILFSKLLRMMVLRCVSPSIAKRARPLPYPVYRTLEERVNLMHYTTVTDEQGKKEEPEGTVEEVDPNA